MTTLSAPVPTPKKIKLPSAAFWILLASLLFATIVALVVTALWILLGNARADAREISTMTNITASVRACHFYAAANAQELPPHLAPLILDGTLPAQALCDPRQGTSPWTPAGPMPAVTTWPTAAPDIEAHCDFVYKGAGLSNTHITRAPFTPILFARTRTPKGEIIIAFWDGHVEKFIPTSTRLAAIMAELNAARAKAGLPSLPISMLLSETR